MAGFRLWVSGWRVRLWEGLEVRRHRASFFQAEWTCFRLWELVVPGVADGGDHDPGGGGCVQHRLRSPVSGEEEVVCGS